MPKKFEMNFYKKLFLYVQEFEIIHIFAKKIQPWISLIK